MRDELGGEIFMLIFDGVISAIVYSTYQQASVGASRRYLTFPPRFWAGWVDALVLWPIGFLATLFLSLDWPRWVVAVVVLIQSLAWVVYTVGMHARWGQTVGKMVTKVKLLDARQEGRITLYQATIREVVPLLADLGALGWQLRLILNGSADKYGVPVHDDIRIEWFLSALPMIWFVAEIVTMFTNHQRRALHDLIAGTVVVRTNIHATARPEAASDTSAVEQTAP